MSQFYSRKKQTFFIAILALLFFGTSLSAQTTFTIGTGTTANTATGYPTPYGNWYWGNRLQMIYRASELTAAGATAGMISSISFNIDNLNSVPALNDFEIKIKNDVTNDLSAAWVTGMTTVVPAATYTPSSTGWNTHTFSSPFFWDGSSNIIVEVCSQNSSFTSSGNASVQWTTGLPTGTSRTYRMDAAGICSNTATSNLSPTNRPNAQFVITSGPCIDPPFAGFASVSDASPCINDNVNLSLDSLTLGAGQSYQWQVSLDGSTWASMPGDTNMNATITAADTAYYRAIVMCGTGVDTSTAVIVEPVGTPLSGTYTINQNAAASATNYTSFQSFFDDLECGGVSGPVIVNVVTNSGPYVERVVAPEISGVSSVNTITINGNGNELQHAGGANDRATLTFDGTDWVTIDNLVIEADGVSYGWTLHLTNGADHNTFTNCSFLSSETSTSTLFANIVFSNSPTSPTIAGSSGNHNHFEDNLIKGGYYGVAINGASAANLDVGNSFVNNEIAEWRYYGMYVRAQDSMVIHGNDIHRETRSDHTFHRAIHFWTGMRNARITNNKFRDFHTGTGGSTNNSTNYVIYMSSANGSATEPNIIANNLIYNMKNQGGYYGIYNFNSSDWWVLHNTFVHNPTEPSSNLTRIYYHTSTGNNLKFSNNIAYVDQPGTGQRHMVYLNNTSADIEVKGNAYYYDDPSAANNHIGYYGGNQSDISDWQAVNNSAFDQSAVVADPFFVNLAIDSLRPQNPILKFIGDNVLSAVPEDFDGTPRTATPDPGAYQFEPPQGADMTILGFSSPLGSCPGNVDVIVNVNNLASDTVTAIRINWSINNVAQTPVVVTDTFSSGNIVPITLGSFTLAAGVTYDIEAEIDSIYPGIDLDVSNNQAEILGYRSGLDGAYTIDQLSLPSATNFSSFEDFADALSSFGVCGSVVATVVSGTGPYTEQIAFGNISGASSTNTITINGNGNELSFLSTSGSERYTLALNSSSYVTIDSLRIVAQGGGTGEFGWGVWLTGGANHNTIKNCEILVDTTQTTTNYGGIIMTSDASNAIPFGSAPFGNHNTIENNTIIGGYYGITCIGNNISDQAVGNKILNNTVTNYRFYGMYLRGQDSLEVRNNEVTRGDRFFSGFVTYYGVFFSTGFTNSVIDGNWIHSSCDNCDNVTSAQYATYFSGASGSAGNVNIFSNNIISDINGDGSAYGIYAFTNNFWRYYHNTIVMDGTAPSPTTWAVYSSGNTGDSEFVNNIISADKSGTVVGMNFPTATNTIGADYNAIYVPNGDVGRLGTTDYSTLADWQTQGFEANGQLAPPNFVDPANQDYTPGTPAYSQQGANVLSDVPVDFFGAVRSTTPDLGAIEFIPPGCAGPFGLSLDSATSSSGFISWNSDETEWVVEWGPVGFLPGSAVGIQVGATSNTMFEVVGFQSNTCYHVFVAEVCNGDTSDYTGPLTICTPKANDAEMLGLVTPEDRDCGEDNTDVEVEIRNNGFFPITQVDITVEISGAFTQTLNHTYTGNLQMGQTDVVVVGNLDFSDGGLFDVVAYVTLPNDEDSLNDTASTMDLRIIPEEPRIENLPFCAGDDSVVLFGVHLPNLVGYRWYDAASGGTLLSTDDTIIVPSSVLPNLWLAYDTAIAPTPMFGTACTPLFTTGCTVGDQIDNVSSTGGLTSNISNLQSGCSSGNYGDFTNQMVDAIPGQTIDIEVQAGPSWSQGFRIWIDWDNDGDFTGPGEDVWNSVTSATTPFTASITVPLSATPGEKRMRVRCDFVSVPTDPCAQQSFGEVEDYTFVVVGGEACSPNRTQADITGDSIPVASFTYTILPNLEVEFVNTSTPSGTNAVWDFGAMGTATGDTVTMTFPETDTFEVCLQVSNFCSSDSVCEMIEVYGIGVETFALSNLNIYPNPNDGRFTVSFTQDFISDVTVELVDLAGKTVYKELIEDFSGSYHKMFDRTDVASGNYLLRIRNTKGAAIRKVTINK